MLIVSVLIIIISIILINKNNKKFIIFLLFLFIFLNITNIYIISNYFTGNGIDESFIYHLNYGIKGAGLISDIKIIIIGVLIFILSIIIPILIYKYLPKNKSNSKIKTFLSIIFLILAFSLHPFTKNILELNDYFIDDKIIKTDSVVINSISGKTFQDIYKLPKQQKATENNKNIIFIYLESFEKLYLDEELFPGLSNGLNEIKKESIYFDNINQVYGTSRTIAGMVGSQCGIPLISSGGGGNSMHGISSFLPRAFCMGDFLDNAGYNLYYIGGARSEFAGKGNFYKTHGFDSIKGKSELIDELNGYYHDRGIYDDSLFDIVYKKYVELSKQEEKFGLFMLTLDTHGEKGVLSNKCNNLKYDDNKNSILNSYNCTDYLLNNFINKVKLNENFKDTIIVIASDHYAMGHNNSIDIIKEKEEERRMLYLIIDPSQESKIISKEGTTLDIGATTLSIMGFDVNNLGLGVNLLNKDNKTIQEEYDDFIFKKWKENYESFWSYPSIKNGFKINVPNKKIYIDNEIIAFPIIINLNENIEIKKILWNDSSIPTNLFEKFYENTNSIYIDLCQNIDISKIGTCILYTDIDGKKIINNVKNNKHISIDKIKNIFSLNKINIKLNK